MAAELPSPRAHCKGHLLGGQTRPVSEAKAAHERGLTVVHRSGRGSLTPHVVITGSLNTLQQSWQQSFTEGCSANTSGS